MRIFRYGCFIASLILTPFLAYFLHSNEVTSESVLKSLKGGAPNPGSVSMTACAMYTSTNLCSGMVNCKGQNKACDSWKSYQASSEGTISLQAVNPQPCAPNTGCWNCSGCTLANSCSVISTYYQTVSCAQAISYISASSVK